MQEKNCYLRPSRGETRQIDAKVAWLNDETEQIKRKDKEDMGWQMQCRHML